MATVSPRRIGAAVLDVLLLASVVVWVVPFAPAMPGVGIDPSWRLALEEGLAKRFVFGRDLVFTSGPLAAVYTQQFHPGTAFAMFAATAWLAAAFAWVVWRVGSAHAWWWRLSLLVCLSLATSRDALLLFYPLVVGWWSLGRGNGVARTRLPVFETAWLFAPFGVLMLAKGSLLIACVAVSALASVGSALAGRRREAAVTLAAPLAGLIVGTLLAGQPAQALPAFFASTLELTAGYGDAMGLWRAADEAVAYAIAAVVLVAASGHARTPAHGARQLAVVMLALVLFVAFKAAFVRHDEEHVAHAASMLLLAGVLVAAAAPTGYRLLALAAALAGWGYLDARNLHAAPESALYRTQQAFAAGLHAFAPAPGEDMATRYGDALETIRRSTDLGSVTGTVDIYSQRQAALIATGADWRPRPSIQSYAAYTTGLADRDRQHLVQPDAPRSVLFTVEPLDGRLPALEDGPSWPELLRRYRPVALRGHALLLERGTPGGSPDVPRPSATEEHALGEEVPLPDGPAIFATLDLRPSLFGHFLGVVYQRPPLRIDLRLADGSTRAFRLVPGMAAGGFLLSPLAESTVDFGLLWAGGELLAGKRVRVFRVTAAGAGWDDRFTLRWSSPSIPLRPDVLHVLDRHPLGDPGTPVTAEPACAGAIEQVDGGPPEPHRRRARGLLTLTGWVASSLQPRDAGERPVVVVTDRAGRTRIAHPGRVHRRDLSILHGHAGLADSGYELQTDVSAVAPPYTVRMGYEGRGAVHACGQPQLVFDGSP